MKNSLKLNQYHFVISIIILILLFVSLSIQYHFTKDIIIHGFYNKTYKDSLYIRENFRLAFDKIQYDFRVHESMNIQKLDFVVDYISKHKNYSINALENELNQDVNFGKYEVFIINKNYIIEDSSYKPDINLDLGIYKSNKTIFDSIFNKKIDIHITPVKIDSASMNLKRYILKLSDDEKKVIQISFVLNSYKSIKELYIKLEKTISALDIYVLSKNMIQKLDFESSTFRKLDFKENWNQSRKFLHELSEVLPQYKKQILHITLKDISKNKIVLNKELSKIFIDENKLLSNIHSSNKNSYHYSLTNGLFNNNDETKLIIKTTFNNNVLEKEINKSFYTFILIFLTLLFILLFLYLFVLNNVSLKLTKIVEHIKNNKNSNEENIIVKEINELQTNYNKLHNQLNNEVKRNELLLLENKEFIADMVHQIRTPLTVIMANASRIEMKGYDDVQEFVKQINSSISMLSNSYEDLSYIISNDSIEYKAVNINFTNFVNERIEFFKHILEANNKTLEYKIEKNINICMNDIELERLIDNNISNAIKHSTRNAKISIYLEKLSNDKVLLSFQSDGKTIKNPDLLFNKNYRENASKRSLGLGLHMVKTICDKNDIQYKVSSINNINSFIYTLNKIKCPLILKDLKSIN
ncbi:MAG: HAMP domain-containing histidine kinase [Campylobacterales bacterium]|nr:HAMP domain-containing histidine kinase [Campylobacterales bacterium]